jgi:ATP-dependent protease HslVU (ClpYQ) peptidase subunit
LEVNLTTIATKDGIIVGDARMSLGATIIKDDTVKVFNVNNHLVGVCGAARSISTFVSWLQKHTDYRMVSEQVGDLVDLIPPVLEQDSDYTALVVTPDKQVLLYESGIPIDMGNDVHMAIGSGGDFALAAMDAGLSAEEAVKIAMKRDVYSGGTITVVSLEEDPEMIDKESAMKMSKEELISKLFPEDETENVDTEEKAEEETEFDMIHNYSEFITLYKFDGDVFFEVMGIEFNLTQQPVSPKEFIEFGEFDLNELQHICSEMNIEYSGNNNKMQLASKILKEVDSKITTE